MTKATKTKPLARPCPFCGGRDLLLLPWFGPSELTVRCMAARCSCCGPRRASKRAAIEAWNAKQPVTDGVEVWR